MKPIRLFLIFLFAGLLLAPLSVSAADNDADENFLFRTGGTTTIPAGEVFGAVIVINGDVVVDGTITDTLVVVEGNATINGTVEQQVVVVRGNLTLQPGATVDDVALIRSDFTRDPAATVTGDISKRSQFGISGWGLAVFGILVWLGITIAMLAFGLVFAFVTGRNLERITATLRVSPGRSFLTAVILWIALSILAVIAMFTVVGIPLGLMIFVWLPVLWLMGYVVTGTLLGRAVLGQLASGALSKHRYWPTVLGLVLFQLFALVPFLGGFVALIAGSIGAGTLVHWLLNVRKTPQGDIIAA